MGYCPVKAAGLTILRCRLIRVREMTAARKSGRHVGRDSARHGSPGLQALAAGPLAELAQTSLHRSP
jgi:hypothetical protein